MLSYYYKRIRPFLAAYFLTGLLTTAVLVLESWVQVDWSVWAVLKTLMSGVFFLALEFAFFIVPFLAYLLLAEADPGLVRISGGRANQTAGALSFLQSYPLLPSLKTPVIMPVFTRVPSAPNLRVGALERDVMQIREGSLKRPDLQFLAMLKDARKRLKEQGIKTHKKIWLHGFGPSGDFCARFVFLHPKNVQAAVCGGTDGVVPLPLAELDGRAWNYPLGAADAREYRGGNLTRKTGNAPRSFITPSDVTTASPGPPRLLSGGRRGKLRWTCWAFLCRHAGTVRRRF